MKDSPSGLVKGFLGALVAHAPVAKLSNEDLKYWSDSSDLGDLLCTALMDGHTDSLKMTVHSVHKIHCDIDASSKVLWAAGKYRETLWQREILEQSLSKDSEGDICRNMLLVRFSHRAHKDDVANCIKKAGLRPITFLELLAFGAEQVRFIKNDVSASARESDIRFLIVALGSEHPDGSVAYIVEEYGKRGIYLMETKFMAMSPEFAFGVTFA